MTLRATQKVAAEVGATFENRYSSGHDDLLFFRFEWNVSSPS